MNPRAISLVLLSLFFTSAFAAEQTSTGSEEMHQAPAQTFELTPTLKYQDNKINFKGGGSVEQSGPIFNVKGEYGFSETLSAGAIMAYDSLSGKASSNSAAGDQKGLEDPTLFLNARIIAGPGALRFGTLFSFSAQKHKIDSNLNSDPSTGGMHAEPFVGYEMYFGTSTVGARLGYNFQLNDRKYTDGQSGIDLDKTVSGGATFKTTWFYELEVSEMAILGFALDVNSEANSTYKTDSTGASRTGAGNTLLGFSFYVPVLVAPNVELLPKFAYGQYTAYDSTVFDSITQWGLEFGTRISF